MIFLTPPPTPNPDFRLCPVFPISVAMAQVLKPATQESSLSLTISHI